MGRGGFLHPIPICFVPWFLFLSLQRHLAAGGLRRPSISGPSLSIPFGGVDPHLVLLPWMPVLPPFLFSSCLVFRSRVLGAIVVASLDFWPNLGLSRLEKATRLFGLMFGRFIFEFGIPGMPDLTTAVGILRAPSRAVLPPIWRGTTARAVLPLWRHGTTAGAVLPLCRHGTTAGCPVPLFPTTC